MMNERVKRMEKVAGRPLSQDEVHFIVESHAKRKYDQWIEANRWWRPFLSVPMVMFVAGSVWGSFFWSTLSVFEKQFEKAAVDLKAIRHSVETPGAPSLPNHAALLQEMDWRRARIQNDGVAPLVDKIGDDGLAIRGEQIDSAKHFSVALSLTPEAAEQARNAKPAR